MKFCEVLLVADCIQGPINQPITICKKIEILNCLGLFVVLVDLTNNLSNRIVPHASASISEIIIAISTNLTIIKIYN